jgi:hypothetical protein
MAQAHFWVVTCKNTEHHAKQNPLHGHRIPIGKTDENSPRPAVPETIKIECNDPTCGKTYSYTASEIIRWYGDTVPFSSHPLVPTSISYDSEKRKIRTSVFVDAAYLGKATAAQLSQTLHSRATDLCIAPALAEGNLPYLISLQRAREHCEIRFFIHAADGAGQLQTKDVASFENGKMSLK